MDMESFNLNALITLGIVLAATVLPFVIGVWVAKSLRMADYGWKIGLILTSIAAAATITAFGWPPKRGVDLAGGVILIYEIDREASSASDESGESVTPAVVAAALRPRLNPDGQADIVIRPYGESQIEIIIPDVDADEKENIKRLISTSGYLEFRILVNRSDKEKHAGLVELAEQQEASPNVSVRQSRFLYNPGAQMGVDRPQATWVKLGLTDEKDRAKQRYKLDPLRSGADVLLRDGDTGNWIAFTETDAATFNAPAATVTAQLDKLRQGEIDTIEYIRGTLKVENPEVLVATNSIREVQGRHLASARMDTDLQTGAPAVAFTMNAEGSQNMAILTSNNVDDQDIRSGLYRYLGIVPDGRLLSAPRLQSMISDRGQITGQFTREEVDFLVNILRAGRLPAVLNPNPTSENQIDPLLGQSTIEKGSYAIAISLAAVLVFMAVYYRFAGIVACLALLINLLLIVAFMIQFNAAFTLPGLAGLVLTVGMSVDANVLIFERIREERSRGSALRMAIRNGFGRATTTIIDANLTTLITAVVLYGIGTDQIRGFAVTLILGILMSMYTAIFCSRVVFDIAERQRWLSELKMMQLVGTTRWNFMNKETLALVFSSILIVVGLVSIVVRGADIFDIDFTGGTSAQIVLQKPMTDDEVRERVKERLNPAYKAVLEKRLAAIDPGDEKAKAEIDSFRRDNLKETVSGLSGVEDAKTHEKYPSGVMWKIDTSIPESDLLQETLAHVFRNEKGESLLISHHLDVTDIKQVAAVTAPAAEATEETPANGTETEPEATGDPGAAPAAEPAPETTPEATPPATETPAPEAPAPEITPDPVPPAEPAPPAETLEDEAPAAEDPRQAEPRPPMPPLSDDAARRAIQDTLALAPLAMTHLVFLQDEARPAIEAPPAVVDPPAAPEEPAAGDQPPAEPAAPGSDTAPATPSDNATPDSSAAPAADDDRGSALEVEPETAPAARPTIGGTRFTLSFDHAVSAETVRGMVARAANQLRREVPRIDFIDPTWNGESKETHVKWTVQLALDKEQADPLIKRMQNSINESPVFFSVSKIGGSVAGKTRDLAIASLAASLLGIVAYIWFRFQKVVYGLAAVVALIHDVLIVVGAIAISAYLAPAFGFLMIEEFKISLPIVAALLTIIGYSLNDTIVVFDRIREVKGKNPSLTGDMINVSINQTLSRTLLTSLTTLLVVTILYFLGGEGVHGFAFALLVGVFIGTYSSIFIASPILLWLGGDKKATRRAT